MLMQYPRLAVRILLAALITGGLVFMAGCRGKDEGNTIKRPLVTGVTVTMVEPSSQEEAFEATGTVRSDNTSVIASRVMGSVISVEVREGEDVRAGQLLLTIDDRDASERARAAAMAVESARQNRDLAVKTWKRYQGLYESNSISRQEMDQAETRRKVAEAEFSRARAMADEARTNLGFTRIRAPHAGHVKEKKIDAGSMAAPGMPLLVIEGREDMYVGLSVEEGLMDRIRPGMPVEVEIGSPGKAFAGSVREIVPAVDPVSRTFTVKIGISGKGLASGRFARVRIPVGRRDAIMVPSAAVVAKGQLTGVYVVDGNGIVTFRLIRAGRSSQGVVEVLSGLSPGERIITGHVERAIDGGIIIPEEKK